MQHALAQQFQFAFVPILYIAGASFILGGKKYELLLSQ